MAKQILQNPTKSTQPFTTIQQPFTTKSTQFKRQKSLIWPKVNYSKMGQTVYQNEGLDETNPTVQVSRSETF